jgi:hypothetical protein
VIGPDSAWNRLQEILAWERDVRAEGGYRAYYEGGDKGTTLQGGGTAGGVGIDFEFFESSLLPSVIPYGFLGLNPRPEGLSIAPCLPAACPEMGITNLLYRHVPIDLRASMDRIELDVKGDPVYGLPILLEDGWKCTQGDTAPGPGFFIIRAGSYRFEKKM